MRSNDAFKGLPHDIFAFTLIQELIARSLDVELGNYKHSVGSLHLYDEDRNRAERYLQEGWQSRIAMPSMPKGDPRPSIRKLLDIEVDIRQGKATGKEADSLDPYWADLVRILQIYKYSQSRDTLRKISLLSRAMDSDVYRVYIDQRRSTQTKKLLVHDTPEQLSLLPQTD
ncbi:hypothetical protein AZSI13_16550 [Azospira sp. I13]|nr:hypothetical protein AZSI13_16550 [Azospira sp. I13]